MSSTSDPPPMTFTLPNGEALDYRHTNDWFNREHRETWTTVLKPEADKINSYLEIGVCEGSSMLWVLTELNPKVAVGIDPWEPRACRKRDKERFAAQADLARNNAAHNLKYWIDLKNVHILKARSEQLLMTSSAYTPNDYFDLIYVDGDHEALPALMDMMLAWRKLAIGGIMVLDDYHRRWLHGRPKSKEAIDAFLMAAESRYHFVYRGVRQVMIRRIR